MIKDVVLRQKKEKEYLLSKNYVKRTKLIQAKKWIDSDLIKVITGPRRAGKSVFSLMLLEEKPFAYFNFDDEIILEGKIDCDELIKEIHFIYGEVKWILFDEIQNLPNWELFINRLHRQGYNLIITGSNAKLLSQELATVLTGRHIPLEIFPFDFKEFLKAKDYQIRNEYKNLPEEKAKLLRMVEEYMVSGSYPEVIVKNFNPKEYLPVLLDALIFKDVVKRYKVKFSNQLDKLASYLINNFTNLYSIRRLTNVLNFKSDITLERYLRYLEEAYLITSLSCFSYKVGERIKSPKKIYVIDNGLVLAKAIQISPDKGRLMENLVFSELLKRGFKPNRDLFYYKTRNRNEIDFVLKNGSTIKDLIQVSYQLTLENQKKEIKSLIEGSEELNCSSLTVITWDIMKEEKIKGRKIKFIPLWQWLTE